MAPMRQIIRLTASAAERFDGLVKEMLSAEDLTSLALEKADAFDYNFMNQLMTRLNAATSQEEIDGLNRVGEAVNFAMQQRLAKADYILRGILKAGDLKVMEAKMRKHLKAGELDMAFDVMLNVNAQQARASDDNDAAANILQHLSTILNEERDKRLPAETRLLRMLLREEVIDNRMRMLVEKLILGNPPARPIVVDEEGNESVAEPMFGEPEVEVDALRGALKDWLSEIANFEQELEGEVIERAKNLDEEIGMIVKKFG